MEFCPNCGQPIDPVTGLCPVCSAGSGYIAPKFSAKLKEQLNSPFLLTLAILQTARAVISFFGSSSIAGTNLHLSLPIDKIWSAVALWLVWSAVNAEGDEMKLSGIKSMNVLVTIGRVIGWIASAILAVVGAILVAAHSALETELVDVWQELQLYDVLKGLEPSAIAIGIGIAAIVIAVVLVIYNIFYLGGISKSIKGVLASFETDQNRLVMLGRVKTWLLVLGILAGLAMLMNLVPRDNVVTRELLLDAVGNAGSAAAYIIGYLYVKNIEVLCTPEQML